jgi:UDPglucose--hexose-1-phosphate uridylyltransferase
MPELRQDLVTERWVIIATERARRPAEGAAPPAPPDEGKCPFCAGREKSTPPEIWAARHSGGPNQPGWKVRVVANKFPALRVEGQLDREGDGIYDRMNGIGAHEVIIETPDHQTELEDQPLEDIATVLTAGKERMLDLLRDERLRYILMFKNVGRQAGASLRHPHSQIIATPTTPSRVKSKLEGAREYYRRKERCVFHDILRQEQRDGRRVVYENGGFLSFCPYASRFPFELCILPKRQAADYHNITQEEIAQLADSLKVTLKKLALALNRPQYNLILHTAPARRARRRDYWDTLDQDFRWHIEILPRISEPAGFEWGTGFYINPTPPEESAQYLREMTP